MRIMGIRLDESFSAHHPKFLFIYLFIVKVEISSRAPVLLFFFF